MKGTPAYIGQKIIDAKVELEEGNEVKAYQSLLDLEDEWNERKEEITDVDVSYRFDNERIEEIKESVEEADVNPLDSVEKMRLVIGYVDKRDG